MTKPLRKRSGEGFTLLELLVVLAIVALLAGVVAFRLELPYRQARLGEAVQRIGLVDQQSRHRARRTSRSVQLVCDLERNAIYAELDPAVDAAHLRFAIPKAVQMGRVRLAGRVIDRGRSAIFVGPHGETPSYALRLDVTKREGQWLFFSGITGQLTLLETESDVDKLFTALAEGRPDAD